MCDFKPGDEVVCVNAGQLPGAATGPTNLRLRAWLEVGRIYVVAAVGICPVKGKPFVLLADQPQIVSPELGIVPGFAPRRFRKVQRRKTDLSIEAFLTIKPGFEEPKRVTEPKPKRQNA